MGNIKEVKKINNSFLFDDEVLDSEYSWLITFENKTIAILKVSINNIQNEIKALEWVKKTENDNPYNMYLLEEIIRELRRISLENILKNI